MDLKEKTQNANRHPWELSRTKNMLEMFSKYMPPKEHMYIADIGAGDMYFDIQLLESLCNRKISCTIFAVDRGYDEQVSEREEIILMKDIQELEKDSMDCILLMDVLEHIEEDYEFLGLVSEKLKKNGIIILTVPAFQSLFSEHDTFLLHYRRYEYSQIRDLLAANHFEILKCHYFYTSLFVARWLQLRFAKPKGNDEHTGIGKWKYNKRHMITQFIELILNIDFFINKILDRLGVKLSGLSLLAVARKRD